MTGRRLRLGMVGGGDGAFIGGVHRMAARIDDCWELAAGAFQSDPARSRAFGTSLRLAPDRCYDDFRSMAIAEARRADRIDAVAIVTPNYLHAPVAFAFLDAGIAVICDKPMATSSAEAEGLLAAVQESGLPFVLTHNYSAYPMVRQARAMIEAGELGVLRVVHAEYAQDWLASQLSGNKQADWRGDPARAGPAGALGDIATHAFHLAEFVTGVRATSLACELSTFVAGRKVDDNAHIMLRFPGASRGLLWASQVAIGAANGLRLRVMGERGGLDWSQETPDELRFTPIGEATRTLRRGGPGMSHSAKRATRLPAGHPEGYLEGFAQIYADASELIRAHIESRPPDPQAALTPGVEDGVRSSRFIEAALRSADGDGSWTPIP
ncbi:MAG: Gfo/Idh/MocA family oxidoreductase [Alphaproteobacteria bacterium]|nr:Gfo/Idh/MocA family oxidoreductase [Alphaproteobacteria bacterium]